MKLVISKSAKKIIKRHLEDVINNTWKYNDGAFMLKAMKEGKRIRITQDGRADIYLSDK